MPRRPRIMAPDVLFHVINRGNNKQKIFLDDEDFLYFLYLMKSGKTKFGLKIYYYVLMPNHVHLLIEPLFEGSLSKFMHDISLKYAKRTQKKYELLGHVWQGRFKSILIEDDAYLQQCGLYIENNPVRAGLSASVNDYPWSSHRSRKLTDSFLDPVPGT